MSDDRGDLAEPLEELAEDMVDVLEKLQRLEATQITIQERLTSIERGMHTTARDQRRELTELRKQTVGERKVMSALHAFRVISPFQEQLEEMLSHLDPHKDAATAAQIRALTVGVRNAFTDLGFVAFEPEAGSPFDPGTMECVGRGPGPEGTVLSVRRRGYRAGETVVRVATVVVGEAFAEAIVGEQESRHE